MTAPIPRHCGSDALRRFAEYCQGKRLDRFLLVCDRNTYAVLGQRAEAALRNTGGLVRTVVLGGGEVAPDERRVVEVLHAAAGAPWTYVAVGSGTVTDIVRFASFSARCPFLCLPTAPSVDAYTSSGAAMAIERFKVTVPCQAPLAVFADPDTLRRAPARMIAAGFGDVLGKYTSLADWKLGALWMDEPYDDRIATRLDQALQRCVTSADEISAATARGIRVLMDALLECGQCMADFGDTRPASGMEHMISHFWEMRLLLDGRPAVLHGAKVGLGTIWAARRYQAIRQLSREEALQRLAAARPPDLQQELAAIRRAYGPVADRVIATYEPFRQELYDRLPNLQSCVAERWEELQAIAASVPPPAEVSHLLRRVHGVTDPSALGLSRAEVDEALSSAHYLRRRVCVDTLGRLLNLW